MVNLTIDGRAIQAPKGKTVLEVADANGVFIPRMCYHPALKPIGSCRLCVVEVKPGPPRPLPACATYVAEGQEITTQSVRLENIRQELMKLVLVNHALECPICDKGGECDLQELTHVLGVEKVDLDAVKLAPNHDYISQMVERHPDRCVTCGRCVHICRDHVGAMAINFMQRGYFTELGSGTLPLDCEFCGSCIDVCPVGALINKQFKYRSRAWEVTKTETVCPFCGGGCTYELHVKDGRIMRVFNGKSVLLCGRGRFGYPVVEAPDRIKTPLIKAGGKFKEATWNEALDRAALGLKEVIDDAGPAAIYGVGSPRATNEANYLFQKFFRQGLGTNNLDNPGRYHYIRGLKGIARVFGLPKVTGGAEPAPKAGTPYTSPVPVAEGAKGSGFPFVLGNLQDLPQADLALVIGMDVTPELPPIGWRLLRALDNEKFRLILANPRQTKFDRYANLSLRYRPGTERLLVAGLLKAFFTANPDWTPPTPAEGLEEFKESFIKVTLREVAAKTGVEEAAVEEAAGLLAQSQAPAIIFGSELLGQDKGQENALALADLFLLVGRPGTPGSALYPVAEKNNTRGAAEVGVLPDRLPGFTPLDTENASAFWGKKTPVTEPGPTLPEMLDLIEADDPKAPQALYLMGGDLLKALPHSLRTARLLKKLKFLVVQDAFMTNTAKLADVILPAAIHAEQEGTFISSAGQLGVLAQALNPDGVRPDWQIIGQLSGRLGFPLSYSGPAAVFQELARMMPLWAGAAPGKSLPDKGIALDLKGSFTPFDLDVSLPGRRPFTLIVGKALQHSGSFTTHHPCGTLVVMGQAALQLNPEDAQTLGLSEGETAKISSSQGEISATVTLAPDCPPGVVFLPEHFADTPANKLTLNSNVVRVTIHKG
jgi:predicted molibdopterin-dependent oxidoreductase YjgC